MLPTFPFSPSHHLNYLLRYLITDILTLLSSQQHQVPQATYVGGLLIFSSDKGQKRADTAQNDLENWKYKFAVRKSLRHIF